MSNRRYGGGNRSFSGNNYSMPVNPWAGGMPPDPKQNNSYMGMNSGFSQLSNPQAQLALALTNLLRPQQPQQPPSLLALPQINLGNRPDFHSSSYDRNNRLNDRRNRNKNNRNSRQGDKRQKNKPYDRRKASGAAYRNTVQAKSKNETAKDAPPPLEADKKPDSHSDEKDVAKGTENVENKEDTDATHKSDNEDTLDEDVETKNKEDDDIGEGKDANDEEKAGGKSKEGKYAGIPARLLKCSVCEKNMWDGESFEKHLRGRAHKQMMASVEDSYKLKANMIREENRLAEEKKMIELNRMRRLGRKVSVQKENHCNMCDYKYMGHSTLHRKSEGHQRLKMFLHPRCKQCRTEFSTRIEWESHRFSPEHLRKLADQQAHFNGSGAMDVLSEVIDDGDEAKDDSKTGDAESTKEDENLILDISEDLDTSDLKTRLPSYKSSRSVGVSLIKEVTGFQCTSCNKFFLTHDLVMKHTKTIPHYDKFVTLIRKKHDQNKEMEGGDKEKRAPEEDEDDNEGNWKRRKLNKEDDAKTDNDDSMKAGEELYDPLEASTECNDEDDVEEVSTESVKIKEEDVSIEEITLEDDSASNSDQNSVNKVEPKEEVTDEPAGITTRRTRNQRRGNRN